MEEEERRRGEETVLGSSWREGGEGGCEKKREREGEKEKERM